MKIVSLLISVLPQRVAALRQRMAAVPGVRVHGEPVDSKLVVTIEDHPGRDVMPTVLEVQGLPGVLATTLTYEYSDDEPDPLERRQ